MSSKIPLLVLESIFVILVFSKLTQCEVTPNFIPSGDFMEFWNSLDMSCKSNRSASRTISGAFDSCLKKIDRRFEPIAFRNYCRNQTRYLDCWDGLTANMKEMCGNEDNSNIITPRVYRATFETYCGKDQGAASSSSLIAETDQLKRQPFLGFIVAFQCIQKIGGFWKEVCEKDLELMGSPDLCTRHSALERCVTQTTCTASPEGKLSVQLIKETGINLGCKPQSRAPVPFNFFNFGGF